MKIWEYAIAVEERSGHWTLWHQDQEGKADELTRPLRSFDSDLAMLRHMGGGGWEAVCPLSLKDGLQRLLFKKRS